jgi:hypothetical protein
VATCPSENPSTSLTGRSAAFGSTTTACGSGVPAFVSAGALHAGGLAEGPSSTTGSTKGSTFADGAVARSFWQPQIEKSRQIATQAKTLPGLIVRTIETPQLNIRNAPNHPFSKADYRPTALATTTLFSVAAGSTRRQQAIRDQARKEIDPKSNFFALSS